MRLLLCLVLLLLGSTAAAEPRTRITVVALDATAADGEAVALSAQITMELRRLIVGKFGPHRLAIADIDAEATRVLAGCKVKPRCLATIGHGAGADRVLHGSVTRKGPGYLVRLVLVDVHRKRLERIVNAVFWQDANDVRTFRAWVKNHYAKLLGARGAHSS
jgi:TolB-like protein